MLYYSGYQLPDSSGSPNDNDCNFIRNAKELQEDGIKFKKREGSSRLFDVVFLKNGTIEIPCLKIDDRTESLFRNLVAYEQFYECIPQYVTDYTILMDYLINTQEDVQILRHSGIIENGLGDDGMIFRGLGNHRIPEKECKHLLDMLYHAGYQPPDSTESPKEIDWYFIRNAKELQEAGIKFKKREGSSRLLFDVDFSENGTIEIPRLKIDDRTESLFRNLVTYEQCSPRKHLYVTDYITLMDCLISTQEDVQILRLSEIIENGLGDDGKVCSLFNNLCRNVTHSQRPHFCYNKVFDGVKEHYNQKRNVWMATLKHDYFNSPWALLSFLAAVVLLLFTLAQTVFTVMSYFQMD
ncbi:hypothetical protein NC651_009356 [Populus alba x Populus x berolinensis]|nr:hypothetical protein NC651_009356 [Populus alba x Populus x berolinensis]